MKEDFFLILPEEITREILRRLPIRSSIRCKSVCKAWRLLIEWDHFAIWNSPIPCLALALQRDVYTVYDESFRPLFEFVLPSHHAPCLYAPCDSRAVIDSVNGLFLVWHACVNTIYVCNPITSEYVALPPPPRPMSKCGTFLGFGVSRISGQYKILCGIRDPSSGSWYFYVYTLGGRGLWKSIAVPTPVDPVPRLLVAAFFNGYLHWLASDLKGNLLMCVFDIHSELFGGFPLSIPGRLNASQLSISKDQLCLCDTSDDNLHVDVWRMNNYGETISWIKEYTFDNQPKIYGAIYPLKVLANGDLLFVGQYTTKSTNELFIYSKYTKDVVRCRSDLGYTLCTNNLSSYTPNFHSLTTMGIHNVELLEVA